MTLDQQLVCACEVGRAAHELGRAADRKARNDREQQATAIMAVPALEQASRGRERVVGRVQHGRGREAVHQSQSCLGPQSSASERGEQHLGRSQMTAAVDRRARGALRDEGITELFGDGSRVVRRREPALLGEHRRLEPWQQRTARAADHPRLREVQVHVDEAGQQHRARPGHRDLAVGWRGGDRLDHAVGINSHERIVEVARRGGPRDPGPALVREWLGGWTACVLVRNIPAHATTIHDHDVSRLLVGLRAASRRWRRHGDGDRQRRRRRRRRRRSWRWRRRW